MVLDMAVNKQHLTDEGSELQGMLAESKHVMEPLMPAIIEERAKCCFQIPKCIDVKCQIHLLNTSKFGHGIREEILRLDDLSVHRKFNQLLLDHDIRKIILSKLSHILFNSAQN